ncbi:Sugar transferase involved in LPS biosynthesis (colanic, teichoic acid) [Neorhodopirellula lusitana]|uniref:Sugar transferase involved in LPS biosynthesis (Colanic, teichoic acid) n=1 Tax=Neorhodopirellula lusitana TaxID=445327 RepID=A0ABY1PY61_9BACT|nr:sugar transferase [Neorhodopirellula lusitana]SMP51670.1 Sugar transferase involved in LPS biosynthesis (colanic, teichoic acid) [Neorhodopirellula lusitana]
MTKRTFDIVVSALLLLILAPLLIVVAVLVRADGGPVFYNAIRAGRDKKPISTPKFRSMIVNADNFLDSSGRPTKDRITKVGRVLRRFSFDELPQLFSVLIGTMSIVGPRPILISDAEQIDAQFDLRFRARPGITGLAQVSGRNSITWTKRYELDCQYVRDWSFLLDLKILRRTISVVLFGIGMSMDRNPDQARP